MKRIISLIMVLTIVLLLVGCTTKIEDIDLDEDEITLVEGESYKVKYDIDPSDAEGDLEWKSDDKDVAVVSGRGRITAVGAGKCTITVEAENGVDAEIEVIVEPKITAEELAAVGTYYFARGKINDTYYSSYDSYVPNMTLTLREDKTGVLYYNYSEYRTFTWAYDFTNDEGTLFFDASTGEFFTYRVSDGEVWYYFDDGDYAILEH